MILTKDWMEEHGQQLEHWKQSAFDSFSLMMDSEHQPYPCVPGMQGFHSGNLRFGFIDDPRKETAAKQLASLLKAYGEVARDTGSYASLVVFIDSRELVKEGMDLEGYQVLFWSVLNNVHELDDQPWPDGIPTDPHHHDWEFCFNGEPYFSFCATPAHQVRKSRSFPCMLIAFQPRWVFHNMNASTSLGQKMKAVIRKRLLQYDGVQPHPDLKWYGQQHNYEWKQYFLSDDESSPSKCPFTAMKNKLKSLRLF